MIYFDNAASTPMDPAVLTCLKEVEEKYYANPSSIHSAGQSSRFIIEKSRDIINKATKNLDTKENGSTPDQSGTLEKAQGNITESKEESPDKKKRKGHGRNGVSDYSGANEIAIPHESLKPGIKCPECMKSSLDKAEAISSNSGGN